MFPVDYIFELSEDQKRKFELELNNRELSPELHALREKCEAMHEKLVSRAERALKSETDSNVIVHNLAVISTEALVSISKVLCKFWSIISFVCGCECECERIASDCLHLHVMSNTSNKQLILFCFEIDERRNPRLFPTIRRNRLNSMESNKFCLSWIRAVQARRKCSSHIIAG